MSQSANVFLVDPNGFHRMDVARALVELGHNIVASVGSMEGVMNTLYGSRLPKVDILIIDGDVGHARDIWEAVVDNALVEKVVEHSRRSHDLGDVFVSKAGNPRETIRALCEAVTEL